eukprot:TRINITY_DN45699_c0_g2_i1.p1 TRINITY_DN45699_c0_g2~~TRINITY_DN45699_c0_g2_i1.p1  ORF type:complete len:809 (-),score=179.50 TRINITY_DN45699_c0_g2_i1:65-2209(-)
MARPKRVHWPLGPGKPTARQLRNEKEAYALGSTKKTLPRDGQALGPDKKNIAVMDNRGLASEPLKLKLDRVGRVVLDGETTDDQRSFDFLDPDGQLSSSNAPLDYETFAARYYNMDKTLEMRIGKTYIDQFYSEFLADEGKDDFRVVQTFAWPGSEEEGSAPAAISLVGVAATSERSRRLAARAVFESEPSALVLQLCRERIGRNLVMPEEHLANVAHYARGYAASNPHQLRGELIAADAINGDWEAMNLWMSDRAYGRAVDEFVNVPEDRFARKLLVLADVPKSRLEAMRREHGNKSLVTNQARSARAKQIVRGLISPLSMGHRKIVGVVDAELLSHVNTWLERYGARLSTVGDAVDVEQGRVNFASDMARGLKMAQQLAARSAAAKAAGEFASSPPPSSTQLGGQGQRFAGTLGFDGSRLGSFINKEGLDFLKRRKDRIAQLTRVQDLVHHVQPEKVWHVAESLGGLRDYTPPGPEAALAERKRRGLRFELDKLEIPDEYLREVGMEDYAPDLWRTLSESRHAIETRDPVELNWWSQGGAIDAQIKGDTDIDEALENIASSSFEDDIPDEIWEQTTTYTEEDRYLESIRLPPGIKKEVLTEAAESDDDHRGRIKKLRPQVGDKVTVHYVGTLTNGNVFDSTRTRYQPFSFNLGKGEVIQGWDKGVATMKQGELAKFTIAPHFAYGDRGVPPEIPPRATLIFEVELLGWESGL